MDPSAKVKNVNTQSSIDTQDTSFPKISKTSSQDGHTHIDLELESIRIRSLSSCYPCLKNIYPAEFVPKPKPKKHESLPSPMNLNAKGFRHLKKNKVSAFILATDQLYLSCPDLDDIIHDSSDGEENSSPITRGSFLEDMVVLNHRDTKRCSKEYESHTLHDLLREDFRMEFNEAVKEQIKSGLTRKSLKGNDEYNLLKSPSVDLNNLTKARTNSILKMLEHNHDIRRKMTGIEQA